VHLENTVLDHKTTFIRPENVRAVQERADDCDAKEIVKYCQEYVERNARAVDLIEEDVE
jgi:hypothetical protein